MPEPSSGHPVRRGVGYGPPVAAFILTVTIFSFAAAGSLDGVPNTENGLFYAMAAVAGLSPAGITVGSPTLLLLARLAGLGMIASLVAVLVTRKRLGRLRDPA